MLQLPFVVIQCIEVLGGWGTKLFHLISVTPFQISANMVAFPKQLVPNAKDPN